MPGVVATAVSMFLSGTVRKILWIAYAVMIPFSLSSLAVLFAYLNRSGSARQGFINISVGFMILGFIVILAASGYVYVVSSNTAETSLT